MKWCELVGQIVSELWLAPNKQYIQLQLQGHRVVAFYTEAECCSHSWIEHISGVAALIGQPIIAAGQLDLPTPDQDPEVDFIQAYSSTLVTAHGLFELEFRNSSNGNYGGRLEPCAVEVDIDERSTLIRIGDDF